MRSVRGDSAEETFIGPRCLGTPRRGHYRSRFRLPHAAGAIHPESFKYMIHRQLRRFSSGGGVRSRAAAEVRQRVTIQQCTHEERNERDSMGLLAELRVLSWEVFPSCSIRPVNQVQDDDRLIRPFGSAQNFQWRRAAAPRFSLSIQPNNYVPRRERG